eukprot:CAMPEP_0175515732 /NCGR_PEP_ID=MMETSP0096-20121207/14084_1 /TAXON_ID=311494 /ORGANISM="Alexandrium monilatum, Strain CCMP3105" /LENGTH=64 /DNA_ID=CAMNT_0016818005 /DNA_START=373 /DNA_END=564 /DNA_ORIENTATION=-
MSSEPPSADRRERRFQRLGASAACTGRSHISAFWAWSSCGVGCSVRPAAGVAARQAPAAPSRDG